MARINVEQKALVDSRFVNLGLLLDPDCKSPRCLGLGLMIHLWNECTERETYVLTVEAINSIAHGLGLTALGRRGVAGQICDAKLGEWMAKQRRVVRLKGTKGRTDWLAEKRTSGRAHGVKGAPFGALGGRPRKGDDRVSENGVTGLPKNPPPAPTPTPKRETPRVDPNEDAQPASGGRPPDPLVSPRSGGRRTRPDPDLIRATNQPDMTACNSSAPPAPRGTFERRAQLYDICRREGLDDSAARAESHRRFVAEQSATPAPPNDPGERPESDPSLDAMLAELGEPL